MRKATRLCISALKTRIDEAYFVASEINRMKSSSHSYSDFAICTG